VEELLSRVSSARSTLPGPHEQVHFSPLELFFKDPESSLLPDVEHFIERFIRTPEIGSGSVIEFAERLEPIPNRSFVDCRHLSPGELAQFLEDLVPRALILAARLLKGLQPSDKVAVLGIVELKSVLRLDHCVRVHHDHDLSR